MDTLEIPRKTVTIRFRTVSVYEPCKRALDVVVCTSLLLLSSPLLLAIAVLIRVTSRGPIVFKQKRLRQGGSEFWCYKFRTMVVDAEDQLKRRADLREAFLKDYKLKNDPRITPVGAFLRRTSMDELPQLFNVLRGDMSLIGPRPIVRSELAKYGEYAEKLLSVPPGLGGYWQVHGRSNTSYQERVEMDMAYIDQRSLPLDLRLLYCTAIAVIRRQGAC
jgi:lipopolysaccharide/colanic/teichoic acid biosynthesis glycosyltransferase